MLIQPDKNELGDLRLNIEEGVAKAKEDNIRMASQYRIPDQDLLSKVEMAVGNPMDWKDLVNKLLRLSTNIVVEKGGYPNAVAVRVIKKDEFGETQKQYVSGFLMERMPEFSAIIKDENDLPKREIRGWRTVLDALIDTGVVTQKKCDLIFGPALGQRAVLWDRASQARNR
jgi:hypothetical protein